MNGIQGPGNQAISCREVGIYTQRHEGSDAQAFRAWCPSLLLLPYNHGAAVSSLYLPCYNKAEKGSIVLDGLDEREVFGF